MNAKYEQFYQEMLALYDHSDECAEQLTHVLKSSALNSAEEQLAMTMVETMIASSDNVINHYLDFIEAGKSASPQEAKEMESAIRRVFASVAQFVDQRNNGISQ